MGSKETVEQLDARLVGEGRPDLRMQLEKRVEHETVEPQQANGF